MFYVVDTTPNRRRLYRLMLPVLWRLALVAGILLFFLASPPVVTLIASPAEQQEQEQRQRTLLKDAARQRDEVSRSVSLPLPPIPSGAEPASPCFKVHTMRFDGAEVLDAEEQATLSAPYRDSPHQYPYSRYQAVASAPCHYNKNASAFIPYEGQIL